MFRLMASRSPLAKALVFATLFGSKTMMLPSPRDKRIKRTRHQAGSFRQ